MLINNHEIIIEKKDVKHLNLKVYPNQVIKVSAPKKMEISSIKKTIFTKEEWINKQLKRYEEQNRITKREYISGEDHYVNGSRYILNVINFNFPHVEIKDKKNLYMYVRKSSSIKNKEKLMYSFYKDILEKKLNKFIPELERKINVKVSSYSIRKMKNKWGSCNQKTKHITFNVDLAKKKDVEIKYVIIHELIHLLEKSHNDNFRKLMFEYCPKWEIYHETLNELLNPNKET